MSTTGRDEPLAPFVTAYDDLVNGTLINYINLSSSIGGLVKQMADMVEAAVRAQRQFLVVASKSKAPPQDVLASLLKPTSDQIQAIQELRERNRATVWFNHLSAVSESIPALGWVAVSPTPGPYVKEMNDASQFYTNKVLVAYKEKDKTHVGWARAWIEFLTQLQAYVKANHTTGLSWNTRGGDAVTAGQSNGAGRPPPPIPPPRGGILPPPPPPPPADLFAAPSKGGEEARSAMMRELNRGTDVTKGLKKVTSDQQTHKNPALKGSSVVGGTGSGRAMYGSRSGPAPEKPPKFEMEGRKWLIEYQVGQKELVVKDTEMNQSVNIYKCKDCLILIKGKINSVTVDSCIKTSVVFDDIVSVVEFVNCQSVQAQSMGKVPTINVEKTDAALIYLSKDSMNTEIVTAKSSAVNISVPDGTGDFIEHPIPEQFKSIFTGKGFKTEPADKSV